MRWWSEKEGQCRESGQAGGQRRWKSDEKEAGILSHSQSFSETHIMYYQQECCHQMQTKDISANVNLTLELDKIQKIPLSAGACTDWVVDRLIYSPITEVKTNGLAQRRRMKDNSRGPLLVSLNCQHSCQTLSSVSFHMCVCVASFSYIWISLPSALCFIQTPPSCIRFLQHRTPLLITPTVCLLVSLFPSSPASPVASDSMSGALVGRLSWGTTAAPILSACMSKWVRVMWFNGGTRRTRSVWRDVWVLAASISVAKMDKPLMNER